MRVSVPLSANLGMSLFRRGRALLHCRGLGGDVVSLPCINGKPGIHPPKEKGDEGERYLERGGEVRVRDRKRVVDYLTSQTRIRATTCY